jgi:NAD(P)-dependent dehydrogenase (short-subunit alcohol dehydrogenase family)
LTQTILILGAGTPDGVGGAIALRFAKAGYHVLVTGRTLEKVEATRDAIVEQGGSADAMACDVTLEDDLDTVFYTLAAEKRTDCFSHL